MLRILTDGVLRVEITSSNGDEALEYRGMDHGIDFEYARPRDLMAVDLYGVKPPVGFQIRDFNPK